MPRMPPPPPFPLGKVDEKEKQETAHPHGVRRRGLRALLLLLLLLPSRRPDWNSLPESLESLTAPLESLTATQEPRRVDGQRREPTSVVGR